MQAIHIGTAGWSIARTVADAFPAEGSGLERYATRFDVAEINSSFYRPHRPSTWSRWRDMTPDHFRFSVKLPKLITHIHKLVDCRDALDAFLEQAHILEEKLGVLLIQLPPKLAFDDEVAGRFFDDLMSRTSALIACEPRHPSWFTPTADALLARTRVARVAADPAICPAAAQPAGWPGLCYWRLHGSPHMYRSSYEDRLGGYANLFLDARKAGRECWCIFDNTASSAATSDALALKGLLDENARRLQTGGTILDAMPRESQTEA